MTKISLDLYMLGETLNRTINADLHANAGRKLNLKSKMRMEFDRETAQANKAEVYKVKQQTNTPTLYNQSGAICLLYTNKQYSRDDSSSLKRNGDHCMILCLTFILRPISICLLGCIALPCTALCKTELNFVVFPPPYPPLIFFSRFTLAKGLFLLIFTF